MAQLQSPPRTRRDSTLATAAAIFLARNGATKDDIQLEVNHCLPEDMKRIIEEFRGSRA